MGHRLTSTGKFRFGVLGFKKSLRPKEIPGCNTPNLHDATVDFFNGKKDEKLVTLTTFFSTRMEWGFTRVPHRLSG